MDFDRNQHKITWGTRGSSPVLESQRRLPGGSYLYARTWWMRSEHSKRRKMFRIEGGADAKVQRKKRVWLVYENKSYLAELETSS